MLFLACACLRPTLARDEVRCERLVGIDLVIAPHLLPRLVWSRVPFQTRRRSRRDQNHLCLTRTLMMCCLGCRPHLSLPRLSPVPRPSLLPRSRDGVGGTFRGASNQLAEFHQRHQQNTGNNRVVLPTSTYARAPEYIFCLGLSIPSHLHG